MSVYETSLHAGARLDMQVVPSESIAVLQESCEGDHPHPHSHEDEGAICTEKGRGTVVVESSEKLQKMLGFGSQTRSPSTFSNSRQRFKTKCVCVCVCVCVCIY